MFFACHTFTSKYRGFDYLRSNSPLRTATGQADCRHYGRTVCSNRLGLTFVGSQERSSGNIRELRNAVERLLLLADGDVDDILVREVLPRASMGSAGTALNSAGPLSSRVEAFESATIR